MRVLKLIVTLFFALSAFGTVFAQNSANFCEPFLSDENGIFINTSIKNDQYKTYIVSNNIDASMSPALAEELELSLTIAPGLVLVSPSGEQRDLYYAKNVPVTLLGGETNMDFTITGSDSAMYTSLSLQTFRNFVMQFNFPESEFCFINRENIELDEFANVEFGTASQYSWPAVELRLNDKTNIWVNFDIGETSGLVIDQSVARGLDLNNSTINEDGGWLIGTLNKVTFGPYDLIDVEALIPQDSSIKIGTRLEGLTNTNIRRLKQTRGAIGLEFLKEFIVTLDLEEEALHIYYPPEN